MRRLSEKISSIWETAKVVIVGISGVSHFEWHTEVVILGIKEGGVHAYVEWKRISYL